MNNVIILCFKVPNLGNTGDAMTDIYIAREMSPSKFLLAFNDPLNWFPATIRKEKGFKFLSTD